MEPFHFGGVIRVRRAKKRDKNFFHLRTIANLFRVMEVLVVLVLISWLSAQLPEAVKSSGEYFKGLKLAVLSPRFVFVLGNVIVIILFAKSGRFSGHDSAKKNDFYSEFVKKSEGLNPGFRPPVAASDYQDKQVIFQRVAPCKAADISHRSDATKPAYRRSQSEKLNRGQDEKAGRQLRRLATEKSFRCAEKLSIEGPFPEDSMSNDEFRQTVEAFIARQQRFLRAEEDFDM